jgi:probable phosphoglycerate mutase
MEYTLYFDGKAAPNPGAGSAAAVLYGNDVILFEIGVYLEKTTNNQAEYRGLIVGLQECLRRGHRNIKVYGDSKLVIEQSSGIWKVKHLNLIDLHSQVKELSKQFQSISFTHVYRDKNKKADELTNIIFESKKNLNYIKESSKQKSIVEMFRLSVKPKDVSDWS